LYNNPIAKYGQKGAGTPFFDLTKAKLLGARIMADSDNTTTLPFVTPVEHGSSPRLADAQTLALL
jgi:hypothetical protein